MPPATGPGVPGTSPTCPARNTNPFASTTGLNGSGPAWMSGPLRTCFGIRASGAASRLTIVDAIETRGLTKRYGHRRRPGLPGGKRGGKTLVALDDLAINVRHGEIFG